MKIVLLVLFVMTMFVWLLSMLGAMGLPPSSSGWLAFFACLFLGIAEFINPQSGIKL